MAAATRFIDSRRQWSRLRDDVKVRHLRQAARSAGEAFAFEEELPRVAPRSYATLVWVVLAIVAAIGLALVYR
jgi:hypothetical protein